MRDVLIIQAARFGDLIQTKRLVLSVARRFKVHIAVDEGLAPLARLVYPDAEAHGLPFHGALDQEGIARCLRACGALRGIGFAKVVNCNYSRLSSAVARLFEPGIVAGCRPAHDSDGGLERSPWSRIGFRASASRAASTLNLVDYWGWLDSDPVAPEQVNPRAAPGGGAIGIAVAGREERRSVPLRALADMALAVARLMGSEEIRLLGSQGELARGKSLERLLAAQARSRISNLCGKTGWAELIDNVRGLACLITPDTGIMHLAAHLGAPVFAIFLSSAWCHETGPYGIGHKIIQAAPACAPCLESESCAHGLACHKLWDGPAFQRFFGQAAAGVARIDAPPGLQLWRTGFDDLGARLELQAGVDEAAAPRLIQRSIIKQRLGLDLEQAPPLADPAYQAALAKFVPESEWMLPPRRYC